MSDNKAKKQKQSFWNMHLTSTVSISLVLFLIGLMCTLLLMARDMSASMKENIKLTLILNDHTDDADLKRLERYLHATPYAKEVLYISKDDALKELVATLGEDPQSFLGYNPLLASLEVTLNAPYANSDSVGVIETRLKTFESINRVVYQRDMANLVNDNVGRISIVLLGIAAILLFISVALINNTIRLAIYSNRFIINTMKLVGATPWFIRKPYIRRSLRNGLIAAILAIAYLGALLYYARTRLGLEDIQVSMQTGGAVCAIIVATGLLITGLSAYFSVGRYVRMSTNDLYFV